MARGGVDAALELDLGNDLRATGSLGYAAAPESASSPVVIVGAASEQPLRQTLTAASGSKRMSARRASASPAGSITTATATPSWRRRNAFAGRPQLDALFRRACAPATRFRRRSRPSSKPRSAARLRSGGRQQPASHGPRTGSAFAAGAGARPRRKACRRILGRLALRGFRRPPARRRSRGRGRSRP